MTRWLRTLISGLAVLALHGAVGPASAAPPTMSAVPGEPVQVDERPRVRIAQDVRRSNDNNAAYLGVAVAVLGAMVWWNRRRRDRFEREDRVEREDRGAAERGDRPETPDGPERRDSP